MAEKKKPGRKPKILRLPLPFEEAVKAALGSKPEQKKNRRKQAEK